MGLLSNIMNIMNQRNDNTKDSNGEMDNIMSKRNLTEDRVQWTKFYKDENGIPYNDYKAVIYDDSSENNQILNIKNLTKIENEAKERNVYKAFLQIAENDSELELYSMGSITGKAVCFSSAKTFEQIIYFSTQYEIDSLLSLLSNPDNFKSTENMKYIGDLDEYGNIGDGRNNSQVTNDRIKQVCDVSTSINRNRKVNYENIK